MYMEVRGQHWYGVLPATFHFLLDRVSSDMPAYELQGSAFPSLPALRIHRHTVLYPALYVSAGSQTQVLMLAWQTFYQLSHFLAS